MTPSEYKTLRERLGLTQAGLAARLGVTRKTVNSRETRAVRITEEAQLALCMLWVFNGNPLEDELVTRHKK